MISIQKIIINKRDFNSIFRENWIAAIIAQICIFPQKQAILKINKTEKAQSVHRRTKFVNIPSLHLTRQRTSITPTMKRDLFNLGKEKRQPKGTKKTEVENRRSAAETLKVQAEFWNYNYREFEIIHIPLE